MPGLKMSGLRDWVKEPLLHFMLIGAALFGVDAAINGGPSAREEARAGEGPGPKEAPNEAPTQAPIVVDEAVRESLILAWTRTHPGTPTPAELEALVERWIDKEVLYREGVRRGFVANDPELRDRVAGQMAYALEKGASEPDPTQDELRAWYAANTDALTRPDRIDFTQVFVDGDDAAAQARAKALLVLLQDGAEPAGLGDTFVGGRRFRARKLADLQERFGTSFARGLDTQTVGTWSLRRSSFGLHLVRVDVAVAASAPSFEAARAQVERGRREEQRAHDVAEAIRSLRGGWSVVREP